MAKQKKASKKYKRNKNLQTAKIRSQKATKKIYEKQKGIERRLQEQEFSDSDQEQYEDDQRYLQLSSLKQQEFDVKKKNKKNKSSTVADESITDELHQFMEKLSKGQADDDDGDDDEEGFEMDDELRQLVKDVQDDSDDDEIILGGDNVFKGSDEEEDDEDGEEVEDDNDDEEDDDEEEEEGQEADDDESDMDEEELERMLEDEDEADAAENAERLKRMEKEGSVEKSQDSVTLTRQRINAWISIIRNTQNLTVLKKLLLAFYVAVHEDSEHSLTTQQKNTLASIPYRFRNEEQYLRVVVGALKYSVDVFDYYCGLDRVGETDSDEDEESVEVPQRRQRSSSSSHQDDDEVKLKRRKIPDMTGKGYQMVSSVIRHFLSTLLHLFQTTKNSVLLTYALKFLPRTLPYFVHSKNFTRKLLRCMLNLLGHEEEHIRFRALLIIREMAVLYPYPFLDLCLKGIYFTLVKNALNYDAHKFQTVEFLKNCIVELYGLDLNRAYHHAFIYIRELAITLRRALEPKAHNYSLVYNWRFINCVDTWCKVICTYHGAGDMAELTYPLVQILIGMCQVQQSTKYVPAVFKVLQMMNSISRNVSCFIPIGPIVMNLFDTKEFSSKQFKKAPKLIDTDFSLRVPKQSMSTKDFQDYLHDEIIFSILDYLQIYSRSISFPELSYPLLRYIKQTLKKGQMQLHSQRKFKNLVQKITETSQLVAKKRMHTEFSVQEMLRKQSANRFLFNFLDSKTPLDELHERLSTIRAQDLLERVSSKLMPQDEEGDDEMESDDEQNQAIRYGPDTKAKKKKRVRSEDYEEDGEDPEVDGVMDEFFDEEEYNKAQQTRRKSARDQPAAKKQKLSKEELKKLKKKAKKAKDRVRTISLNEI